MGIGQPDRDLIGTVRGIPVAQVNQLVGLRLVNLEPVPGLQVIKANADPPAIELARLDQIAAVLGDVHGPVAARAARRFIRKLGPRDARERPRWINPVQGIGALVVNDQPPGASRQRRHAWLGQGGHHA